MSTMSSGSSGGSCNCSESEGVGASSIGSSELTTITLDSHPGSGSGHPDRPFVPDPVNVYQICKVCGKECSLPEIKMVPSQGAWCAFIILFFTGFWWISYLPFFMPFPDCCSQPVQICPHCYRRMDRTPV